MMRLERYLLGQLLRPILGVFAVVLVIVLAFYFSRYLADAVIDRLSIGDVARLASLRVLLFFDVLVPGAVFLGVIVGLGRLQTGYEITAIAAAGVGRRALLRVLLTIALTGLLLVAALTHLFRPWAYTEMYRMEAEMAVQIDLDRVEPGRFEIGNKEWMIFAERRENGALAEVLVHQRLPTTRNLLRARRLQQRELEDGTVALDFIGDVRVYSLETGGAGDLIHQTERLTVLTDAPPPQGRNRIRRALTFAQLMDAPGELEWGELQWRTLMPLSVFLLALVGLAMARINPRTGQTSKLINASIVVALYFSVIGTLSDRVDAGTIPIWPGLFWVPLLLLPLLALVFWLRWRGPGAPL
ncbi:MAG: LptF/LptG family permease [Wenzhouxiangellaceae bacterium]|nr:LptF/LptG family permease [Wenzhouxiangellaceae bacterium]